MTEKEIEARLAQCGSDMEALAIEERKLYKQLEEARNPREFVVNWESGSVLMKMNVSSTSNSIMFSMLHQSLYANLDVCQDLHSKLGRLIATARKANFRG